MRFESFFCGLLAMGISGCGGIDDSTGASSEATTLNPGENSDEVNLQPPASASNLKFNLPYHLVETTTDGSRIIEYEVAGFSSVTQTRVTQSGAEEQFTRRVPQIQIRQARVPPGVDIQDFLAGTESGAAPAAPVPDSGNQTPAEPE